MARYHVVSRPSHHSGLSFTVSTHATREHAERRARNLARQVSKLYGNAPRAHVSEISGWTVPGHDQLTTGYSVSIDGGWQAPDGLLVKFEVVGPDDYGEHLSYARHAQAN